MNTQYKFLLTSLVLFVLFITIGGFLFFSGRADKGKNGISCTMEAKLCSDGSAVGRSGPNCEFTECPEEKLSADLFNAVYIIEGEKIALVDGKTEKEIISGSASKTIVQMFGEPAYGDLDEDGDSDALVFLMTNFGGSGTFYYASVAINKNGKYGGTNSIFLGDRIAPQALEIRDGVAIVNYAVRAVGESMVTPPSSGESKYILLKNDFIEAIAPLGAGESVYWGYLVWGHEVRSFMPCGENNTDYWLMGDSPALSIIKESYQNITLGIEPALYTSVFAVIAGEITDVPTEGFGADYEHGIRVGQLLRISLEEKCGK